MDSSERKRAIAAEAVMRTAELIGETFIEGLVRSYRERIPVSEIAKTLQQKDGGLSDISLGIVASAIRVRLRELVPLEERKAIEFEHRSAHAKTLLKQGKGLASLTEADRSRFGRMGGEESGRMAYGEGRGIFGLSVEALRSNAKKGGAASHLAQGNIPWALQGTDESNNMNELDLCLYLATLPEFKCEYGRNKGRVNNQKIADELNKIFHGGKAVRTASHVNLRRSKVKQ